MKSDERNRAYERAVLVLLTLTVLGLLVDALLTVRTNAKLEALAVNRGDSRVLPCAAIPTRFVLEEPACAQKLLESMNVTNVRVSAAQKALLPSGPDVATP